MGVRPLPEFVRVDFGWVDVNKFRVECKVCGHVVTHRTDFCEHTQPNDESAPAG